MPLPWITKQQGRIIESQELTFGSRLIETQDKYPRYKK